MRKRRFLLFAPTIVDQCRLAVAVVLFSSSDPPIATPEFVLGISAILLGQLFCRLLCFVSGRRARSPRSLHPIGLTLLIVSTHFFFFPFDIAAKCPSSTCPGLAVDFIGEMHSSHFSTAC
jgi:hypothetical protein